MKLRRDDNDNRNAVNKNRLFSFGGGAHAAHDKAKNNKNTSAKHSDDSSGTADDSKNAKLSKSGKLKRRLIIIFLVLVLLVSTAIGLYRAFVKPPAPNIDENFRIVDVVNDPDKLNEIEPSVSSGNLKRKDDYFTMLVVCTDEGKTRTDAMLLISFDVANKTVNMMNIPRDTMSNVSRSVRKINGAYAHGKLTQMFKELKMLLGVPIDRYVIFDFDGVAQMVEAIGGVKYNVPINMNYDDPTQNLHIHIKKGEQLLNGKNAVGVLRFRKNNNGTGYATGDIGRIENFQNFIKALAEQMITPSTLTKLPDLAKAVLSNTETDLKTGEMVWFGIQGLSMDLSAITTYTLPGYSKSVYEPGIGLYQSYWIPKETELLELINSSFNPYTTDITDLDIVGSQSISRSSNRSTTPKKSESNPSTASKNGASSGAASSQNSSQPTGNHSSSSNTSEPSNGNSHTEDPIISPSNREEPWVTENPSYSEPPSAQEPEPSTRDMQTTTSDPDLEKSPVI